MKLVCPIKYTKLLQRTYFSFVTIMVIIFLQSDIVYEMENIGRITDLFFKQITLIIFVRV